MITGIYVRVKREGKYETVEFQDLTEAEMQNFADEHKDDGWKWAIALARWIKKSYLQLEVERFGELYDLLEWIDSWRENRQVPGWLVEQAITQRNTIDRLLKEYKEDHDA